MDAQTLAAIKQLTMDLQSERFTEIADAIRTQDGSTGKIPALNFPNRILALPQGIQTDVRFTNEGESQNGNFLAIRTAIIEKEGPDSILDAPTPDQFAARILALKVIIPTYTVTTAIDPTGSGTATGAGTYQQGASVTVTATPAAGYMFVGWKSGGTTVSTSSSHTFTVTGDVSLTAVFEVEKTSRLPAGYTEVEWIQNSTTSSYFTLSRGLSNSNFTIEISAPQWTSSSTVKYIFYGAGYFNLAAKSSSLSLTAGTSSTTLKTYSVGTMTTGKMVITGSAKTFTLNGSSTTLTYNNLATTMTFPYKTAANALIIRLYSFKATKTSSTSKTYNFELIPCINPSGTVGLYDLTNAEFIAPTAGTFIAGPAV